jgi:hypothetical protein
VSYGHFIHTMSSFQWEYLTSLGFILFGYASVFGATTAIVINWMAGLLAVLSVFLFGRTFLGRGRGLLSALLYYALPIIGHFSFADMKIDNAVFTMGTLGTFTLFLYLFGSDEERGNWRWLALAGFFSGIAFSMKITATMVVAANGAVLLGALLHPLAFAGGMMGALTVFGLQGNLDFAKIGERIGGIFTSLFSSGAFLAMFLGTVVCLALAIWKAPAKLKPAFRAMLLFIAWFALALFPWVVHNNILFGNTIPRLELNAPNPNSAQFDLAGKQWGEASQNPLLHSLPPELAVNTKAPECEPTGHLEELDRYWGFRHGWEHYITLPWRMVMNLDSAGYYVTTAPILLLFPLLLLLPFFWRPEGRWLRWLFLSTLFILLQWILLGNGVPWYGIGVFLGLVIGIEALVARAPDMPNRIVIICFVTLSLLVMFSNRLWQFEMQRNLFEYPMGKVSYEALRERTIPHYNDIADIAVERHTALPERPFLYRVGTFIPYFVPKNLDVIGIADHQLDTFNCINQEHDAGLTTQRLKALGFNSMVIDTNTATIERDPNGTLHKKVQALFDYLNSPNSGLQGVISDSDGGVVFVLISP